MAKINKSIKSNPIYTHEGGRAKLITDEFALRRSVMSCLLWEDTFYEDGIDIAERISNLIPKVDPGKVADVAKTARTNMKLRHVPLLIAREMARYDTYKIFVSDLLNEIIKRPDELTEFMSIYWKDGKEPISAQVKKGLAKAFNKFDAYQLAKYNRDTEIKLRDVLFLCHAKPENDEQEALWKQLIDNTLPIPETWEVLISKQDGISRKDKWEKLLSENKLGALALLRNLRNMQKDDVNKDLIIAALKRINIERVLPFRFITAAQYNPELESYLEDTMFKCLKNHSHLENKTILLIDVSGSMKWKISSKSDINRIDVASSLAILLREISSEIEIYTFSNHLAEIPARRGFALRDAIKNSQFHGGTYLAKAMNKLKDKKFDRLIIITDEQCQDDIPNMDNLTYLINVASYQKGVGYGSKIVHIDGFSESVIDYIIEYENFIENYDN